MTKRNAHESIAELKNVARTLVNIENRTAKRDGAIKNEIQNVTRALVPLVSELNKIINRTNGDVR